MAGSNEESSGTVAKKVFLITTIGAVLFSGVVFAFIL